MNAPEQSEAEIVSQMAAMVADYARKHGVSFMYITDMVNDWDFESTGSPEWSADAADTLTEWTVNLIEEDENSKIDELVMGVYTDDDKAMN